jgi:hypothetical protein
MLLQMGIYTVIKTVDGIVVSRRAAGAFTLLLKTKSNKVGELPDLQ